MRDVSGWSGSVLTGKFTSTITLRQRTPNFSWYDESTYYTYTDLGETWGDSPNVTRLKRSNDLPAQYVHGKFIVAGDSVALSNGNILRITALTAGDQGVNAWWKEVAEPADLEDSYSTLTFTNAPRAWTSIGLAEHSDPLKAAAFYIRDTDGKLAYLTYTSGSGWGSEFLYLNTPVFYGNGVSVAPIDEDFGFVYSYSSTTYTITLYNFDGGTWVSQTMPGRYQQQNANAHWFDAEPLGSNWLITYCNNGTQMGCIYDGTAFSDPWPIFMLDVEFGAAQTRICKLTTVGSKIIGTAWTRFANSRDEYDASYYHLVWTTDGYNWAIPSYGYIGQTASRGKLHIIDDNAYIIGGSVCYVGNAVTWLGGSYGTLSLTSNSYEVQGQQDMGAATEIDIRAAVASGYDKTLLVPGSEVIYSVGPVGDTPVDIAYLSIDTPGNELTDVSDELSIVSRGPLKELIGYSMPMDRTFEGARADHQDFKEGGVYARWGDWGTENGSAYCETHDGESRAVATVGTQYSGQFELQARLRITSYVDHASAGVVFWYEGPQDYYYFFITGDSSSRAILRRVSGGTTSVLINVSVTGGVTADTWYHIDMRYKGGVLYIWLKPEGGSWQAVTPYSSWTLPEPHRWYAGLYAQLPRTTTTASLSADATNKVRVVDTQLFPSSGSIKMNNEVIIYPSKTSTQFGFGSVGSLIRGVRSTRTSHPEGSNVHVDRCRVEFSDFSIYEINRSLSIAEAVGYLVTSTGISYTGSSVLATHVYTDVQGSGWILQGTYSTTCSLFFWTNGTDPPTSGIELRITDTSISLYDVVGGLISTYPTDIESTGTFRVYAKYNTIVLWCNGSVAGCFRVPGDEPRIGAIAADAGILSLTVAELCEPVDAFAWTMQETARDVIERILEGRDAQMLETYQNKIKLTTLRTRPSLGSLDGTYTTRYTSGGADQEWASAMVAWGAEDWVLVVEPDARELRWTQWQAPYIYDRATLKDKAQEKLAKLWALRSVRFIEGPFDPRVEVGDEYDIDAIRGIAAGTYIVKSVEIMMTDRTLDMRLGVYKAPNSVTEATWGIIPGIDRPTRS